MEIEDRLLRIEGQPEPLEIWVDHHKDLEIDGWTLHRPEGATRVMRQEGETVNELYSRARRFNHRNIGKGKATIFLAVYHPEKKRGFA